MTPVTQLVQWNVSCWRLKLKRRICSGATPEAESFQLENQHISRVKCVSRAHYSTGGMVLMAGLTAQLPHGEPQLWARLAPRAWDCQGLGWGGVTHEPAVRASEPRLEEGSILAICCTTSKVTLHVGCMADCGSVFVLCLCVRLLSVVLKWTKRKKLLHESAIFLSTFHASNKSSVFIEKVEYGPPANPSAVSLSAIVLHLVCFATCSPFNFISSYLMWCVRVDTWISGLNCVTPGWCRILTPLEPTQVDPR